MKEQTEVQKEAESYAESIMQPASDTTYPHCAVQAIKWRVAKDGYIAGHSAREGKEQEGSKWIPVSERMPEIGQEVIVYGIGQIEPYSLSAKWMGEEDEWRATEADLFPYPEEYQVTHWMAYPSPPSLIP